MTRGWSLGRLVASVALTLAAVGCGSGDWAYESPSSRSGSGRTTVYIGHSGPYGPGWGYRPGYRPRPPIYRPPYRPGGPSIQPVPTPR